MGSHVVPARADDPTTPIEVARACIESLAPELAPARVVSLGRGWDHDVFRVNDAWVFRFPRNDDADAALEKELALLPWLAPKLPLAIPALSWHGREQRTGWRFVGHRFIAGRTVADAGLDPRARERLALPLGEFVSALHAIDVASAPLALPADPYARLDATARAPTTRAMLADLRQSASLPPDVVSRLLAALDDCPARGPANRDVIVHADLHPANLVVDDEGQLVGAIDWVDVHRGDRALDIASAFELLPPAGRERFLALVGVDPATTRRARWRAVDHTTRALSGAIERNLPTLARSARAALCEISIG
jgi:aminoglycoside phosphotransferase (APT) family kinase protein